MPSSFLQIARKDTNSRGMAAQNLAVNEIVQTMLWACNRIRQEIDDREKKLSTYIDIITGILHAESLSNNRKQKVLTMADKMIREGGKGAGGRKEVAEDAYSLSSLAILLGDMSDDSQRMACDVVERFKEMRLGINTLAGEGGNIGAGERI